jgi:hypothetical protein
MKQLTVIFSFTLFLGPITLLAQEPVKLSRFTTGFELSAGLVGHDYCSEHWGYFRMGNNTAYRFSRVFSLEASLNYLHLEGLLNGYSKGNEFSLRGFQTWQNVTLTLGPSLHFSKRKGREWSFTPKAGMMLNIMSQELQNNKKPYQNRRYKPDFLPVYEAGLRMGWWFTERLALETGIAYFGSLQPDKALRLKSVKGVPEPSSNQTLPDYYLEAFGSQTGKMFAFNFSLGLRYRLYRLSPTVYFKPL